MLEKMAFHQVNRARLMALLPENSAVLVSSGSEVIRNRDVEFPFRADSDFFYLTGFSEPDAVLLLVKSTQLQSHLFLRPKDPEQETWQGRRLGIDAAPQSLLIDQAWSIDDLSAEVENLLANMDAIYVSFAQLGDWLDSLNGWISGLKQKVRKGVSAPTHIADLDGLLHEMRLVKSVDEIEWLRKAAQITVAGHLAAMKASRPGKFEYQLQAELEAEFKRLGSPRVAFNSIVASGENACILHYTENSDEMGRDALVLVDAGAEYQSYAGDITTTFPASGQFTPAQAQLYSLVLTAQQTAISMVKPGVVYDEIHQQVIQVLTEGLVQLGILQGQVEQLIKDEAFKRFFMHGTGHWLGMDVHDVGLYKLNGQWRPLEVGMVMTIEPGLYISSEHADVDAKWHGIGIRIEDDVLVTETGCEVLTAGLPRTVMEIESMMRQD